MMAGASKAILFCLAVGLMGIVVAALPFTLKVEENFGLDLLFRMRGTITPPKDVVVVSIDRNTTRELNLPTEVDKWPRSIHAQLIRRLNAAGAAVIAFDLMFNEPQSAVNDAAMAESIAAAGNVILAQVLVQDRLSLVDSSHRPTGVANIEKLIVPIAPLARAALAEAPFPLPKIPISLRQFWTFKTSAGDMVTLPVVAFHAFVRPAHDRLLRLAAQRRPGMGFKVPVPADGRSMDARLQSVDVLRRLIQKEPDLAEQLLADVQAVPDLPEAGRQHRLMAALIELYRASSSRYLNLYGPSGTIRSIPYHRVIAAWDAGTATADDLDLSGKAVFVGLREGAWGQIKDGFHTVFTQADGTDISGVEIAATAFANILQGSAIRPPGLMLHLALVLAWGTLVALISLHRSVLLSAAVLSGLTGLYLGGAWSLFSTRGWWMPLAVPLLIQMPVAYFSVLVRRHQRLIRERQNIRDAFGYYLPNPVVDRLSRNINHLHEGGQVLYGVCLFTDAQKYTPLSEALDPVALTRLMNQYYEAIFKPIRENEGIILQVVGDSVLSIWASPRPDNGLKAKACEAALAICESMNPRRQGAGREDHHLPTRIGLHSGYILLGNIGAMDHFEYRPVGDIVNTASRLEGLNKQLGTWVLASGDVLDSVNGFMTRDMGKFVFVGKSKHIRVRELVLPGTVDADRRGAAHENFDRGLKAFRRRSWADARAHFARSLSLMEQDGPSQFYLDMCTIYQQAPPETDWDGSVALKRK